MRASPFQRRKQTWPGQIVWSSRYTCNAIKSHRRTPIATPDAQGVRTSRYVCSALISNRRPGVTFPLAQRPIDSPDGRGLTRKEL